MEASSPEVFDLLVKGEELINQYNESPSNGAFATLIIQLMFINLELIKDAKNIDLVVRDFKVVLIKNSPESPEENISAYFLSPIDPT